MRRIVGNGGSGWPLRAGRALALAVCAVSGALSAAESNDIHSGGDRLLAFSPADPWGNDWEPAPDAKPAAALEICALRGTRQSAPLALANLSDTAFLGQVKVFDAAPPGLSFNHEGSQGAARRVTVEEAIPLVNQSGGRRIYDPLAPLPMGTVVRIPARTTAALWFTFDARDAQPGEYSAVLCIKRANPLFKSCELPVKIKVVDASLKDPPPVRMNSTQLLRHSVRHPGFAKFLVAHGFTTAHFNAQPAIWSSLDKNGNPVPGDASVYDGCIRAMLAAGLPPGRLSVFLFLMTDRVCFMRGRQRIAFGSDDWRKCLENSLAGLYGHLRTEFGLGTDRIILLPVDEPEGDPDDPGYKSTLSRAIASARAIKAGDPSRLLMVDPRINGTDESYREILARLAECFDYLKLYRPRLTPARTAFARTLPFKDISTYSILGKSNNPAIYRRAYWENARDGFGPVASYWHLDAMAGGDGFDPTDANKRGVTTDYGTVYADFDNGSVLSSRRQLASDAGYDDIRLVYAVRERTRGNPAKAARVEAIVKEAADAGTMAAIEKGRAELVALLAGDVER